MSEEFSRFEMLIGKDAVEKLSRARVIIFGIGGVGGYTAEALARCGVGTIDIVDNDKISVTNINRQIYALHSTIGQYKVDVAKGRILDINPLVNVMGYKVFYTQETAYMFDFSGYDYVIDAIDTVSGKIAIIENAKLAGVPVISAMGAGNKLNPVGFEVTDISKTSVCPLARVMRTELKKRGIKGVKVVYSKELPVKAPKNGTARIPASCAFVPSVAGLIMAGEVVKTLLATDPACHVGA